MIRNALKQIVHKHNLYLALVLVFFSIIKTFPLFNNDVFIDELLYLEIAKYKNLLEIISINHDIPDHGILYYIYLKFFLLFSSDIIWLRWSNFILYWLASIRIFQFFDNRKHRLLAILAIVVFSLNHYFINIHAMLSPFNLVSFFAICSVLLLIEIVNNQLSQKHAFFKSLLFIFFTVLGFYSDYSFFYMFFFYLTVLIWVYFKRPEFFWFLFKNYIAILIFIIPGIFQFIYNHELTTKVFSVMQYKESNFLYFLNHFSFVLFRFSPVFSTFIFAFIMISPYLYRSHFLTRIISISIFLNILLLFLFNNNFLSIFIERSFWFFYFFIFIQTVEIISLFIKKKQYVVSYVLILTIILSFLFKFTTTRSIFIQGNVSVKVPYKHLIQTVINRKDKIDQLILIDSRWAHYVLVNYFFSDIYPSSGYLYDELKAYKEKVAIKVYKSCEQFDEDYKSSLKYDILFFNTDYCRVWRYNKPQNRLYKITYAENNNKSGLVKID